ncbi:MAG: AMP-binding protein [Lachnospiraceae bacterium]|nr:AMP-binding protein [Lachnospiraceae bacterium]
MNIEIQELEDGLFKLIPSGRIDTNTSAELRTALSGIYEKARKVLIDFREVAYISSAGLRELLVCRKRYQKDAMSVENVSPAVYEIFETTGFDTIIPLKKAERDMSTYVQMSIKQFLASKVSENPDKVVLVGECGEYTWKDIDKGSQILADDLARMGVGPRSHVGLCGLNSVNWILAFYALQKLGAMSMLINPNQRAVEIASVAKVGDIATLIYGELPEMGDDEDNFLGAIRDAEGSPVKSFFSIRNSIDIKTRFDEYDAVAGKYKEHVEADDPCVVIFTSGSTGRPKGVLLSSYNILNAASGNCEDQTINPDDRTCLILPLFHIFGLVAGLLANGMADSTIYIPKDIRTGTLLELISSRKCTIFHSVPTMLIALMNNQDFQPEKLASLRCTIISGAAATESQILMFQKAMPNNHFLSSYGLSEMAPVSITPYDDTNDHVLHTVGKPVRHINIKIRNMETGEDCLVGESGEILVQGFNLMTGYYKVPIEDQSIDDEGWLHTGDLGYMTEDGYVCLSGRLKELIIRGGENIMPGEVESAISACDIIDNVKVIGVPSDFFGEEVGACIKLKPGCVFDEDKMREELKVRLAKFKIPQYFLVYDAFPMLGTGKIDTVTLKKDALAKLADKKG